VGKRWGYSGSRSLGQPHREGFNRLRLPRAVDGHSLSGFQRPPAPPLEKRGDKESYGVTNDCDEGGTYV
jgi:hypothetical protein